MVVGLRRIVKHEPPEKVSLAYMFRSYVFPTVSWARMAFVPPKALDLEQSIHFRM